MAALWSFLGFVALCASGSLCAAFSLAQNQLGFQWPGLQSPQLPNNPVKQPPPLSDPIPPTSAPTNPMCNVQDLSKVRCGEPNITPTNCLAINCCFDGQMCYYGNSVTVQCTRDGQFVVVVARDTTLPKLSLDSISLLGGHDAPCAPVGTTATFAIYQFTVTACGTTMMMDGDYLVYENRMTSSYEVGIGPLGSITRDSHYELLFQCRYSGTSVEALVIEVNAIPPPPPVAAPGPLRVELRLANGNCHTKGCVEEDYAYTSYYADEEYPVTRVLRQPVYVEVRLLERTDPNVFLTLGKCWATSSPDPTSAPQWDLILNGCPNPDDHYQTKLLQLDASSGLQFPNHYKRFIVKMFTFVDQTTMAPLMQSVYIHCTTSACTPTAADSCVQSCNRKRRDTRTSGDDDRVVVSSREIIYMR